MRLPLSRRTRARLATAVATMSVAIGGGCVGGSGESIEAAPEPAEPGTVTCELCAMVVREQPASRAQVVHRDGTRVFLCAVSELPAYVSAPSPHGKPAAVWVEALLLEDGPAPSSADSRPWIAVETAHFVVGGPVRPVMGESVLPYATAEAAASVAEACGGRTLAWPALVEHLLAGLQ